MFSQLRQQRVPVLPPVPTNWRTMMTTTRFASKLTDAHVREGLSAPVLARCVCWRCCTCCCCERALRWRRWPVQGMLWITTLLGLRLSSVRRGLWRVIVSVARDCRVFARMTLCKEPSVFVSLMLVSSVRWTLHRLQSRLSQCLLEAQPLFCTSGIVAPTLNSLDDISPSMKQTELCCCCSVPPLWPRFCF